MNWMRAVRLVAQRELVQRARSKAYIVSTVFTTLLLLGAVILPTVFDGGSTTHEIGSVGAGNQEIVDTANLLEQEQAEDDEATDVFELTEFATEDEARAALSDGDVEAVLVDGTTLTIAGAGAFGGSGVEARLQRAAGTMRVQEFVASDDSAADVVAALTSEPLEIVDLQAVEGEDADTRSIIAFGGLILMYIAVLTYGAWMLSGVTEEKTSRVVEVLLSTLKPWQMFAGKLIGIGLLGVGQLLFVLALGLVALRVTDAFALPELPIDQLITLVIWFLLGFTLYAALFGAAGSTVSRMEDAQTAAAPMSITAVLGYLLSFASLNDPDGLVAIVATYVPLTSPYVVPIRTALRTIEWWEIALAILVMVASIVVVVRLAGRVYAGGLLQTSGKIGWRQAFRGAAD